MRVMNGSPHAMPASNGQVEPRRHLVNGPKDVVLLAAWLGLVAGTVECLLLAVTRFWLHRRIHLGPDLVWMSPAAEALVLVALGLLVVGAGRLWPKLVSERVIVFALTLPASIAIVLIAQRLNAAAQLVIATGLAVQAARSILKYKAGVRRIVRPSVPWLAVAVVAMAAAMHLPWQLTGGAALSVAAAPASGTPNVLFITLDTVRAQNLSLYGYERATTPELEKLARRGVVFDTAISAAPWTLPSYASMFTGRYPDDLSTDWFTPLDRTYPVLAEVLAAKGFRTAGFVANTVVCSYEFGLNRGFAHYEDYLVSAGELARSSSLVRALSSPELVSAAHSYRTFGRKSADDINDAFLRWLSANDSHPFFAFLNYFDAHAPYSPASFAGRFGDRPRRDPWHLRELTWRDADVEAEVEAYDESIAYLDMRIGALLRELDRRKMLDRTLVVVTSDHGEEFGEHKLFGHGNSLYLPSLHVPLIVSLPSRVPPGRRVTAPVSLRDLPATIAELAQVGGWPDEAGVSLAKLWSDEGASTPDPVASEVTFAPRLPPWFPVSKGDMASVVAGKWHYIRNGDGSEELYDLEADPSERRNVANTVASEAIMPMRTALAQRSTRHRRSN
jgi:arylsulfatase A-like enzyme